MLKSLFKSEYPLTNNEINFIDLILPTFTGELFLYDQDNCDLFFKLFFNKKTHLYFNWEDCRKAIKILKEHTYLIQYYFYNYGRPSFDTNAFIELEIPDLFTFITFRNDTPLNWYDIVYAGHLLKKAELESLKPHTGDDLVISHLPLLTPAKHLLISKVERSLNGYTKIDASNFPYINYFFYYRG